MSTILHDLNTGVTPQGMGDAPLPTLGAVTTTPNKHIDSINFLQETTFTGIEINVPLPLGAENGFQPMFALRVTPVIQTPTLVVDNALLTSPGGNMAKAFDTSTAARFPVRVYNGAKFRFTGPEPPQSIFRRSYRFFRGDIIYTIRLVSTYTGGGILLAIPVKGIPRGMNPISSSGTSQLTAGGMLFNSNIQCDLSKTRQMRVVVPHEYPTEYREYEYPDSFEPRVASDPGMFEMDNWIVFGTRGNLITPDNTTSLKFYVDYGFSKYSLHTPLLPVPETVYPSVPNLSFGNPPKDIYFEFDQSYFPDHPIDTSSAQVTLYNQGGIIIYYDVSNATSITPTLSLDAEEVVTVSVPVGFVLLLSTVTTAVSIIASETTAVIHTATMPSYTVVLNDSSGNTETLLSNQTYTLDLGQSSSVIFNYKS